MNRQNKLELDSANEIYSDLENEIGLERVAILIQDKTNKELLDSLIKMNSFEIGVY